jgi:hypothetical protein
VKKVLKWVFLGKDTLDNAMLKKNFMKLESEHSPCRSLTRLAEQAQVSTTTPGE